MPGKRTQAVAWSGLNDRSRLPGYDHGEVTLLFRLIFLLDRVIPPSNNAHERRFASILPARSFLGLMVPSLTIACLPIAY
jgi:hypothetical protein